VNVKGSGHVPVLRDEVLEALRVREGGIYVDATVGGGGHAAALLARLGPRGRLLALDRDPQAVAAVRARFGDDPRVHIHHAAFSRLGEIVAGEGLTGKVDGILFDLGVSSPQLDEAARGFSFRTEGPLDMRMDPQSGEPASAWIARAAAQEIERVLREYGEERYARRIARAIVRARAEAPITTTTRLAAIVRGALPASAAREPGQDPATRSFQAIRIYVNRELEELAAALPQAVAALAPGGRLAVVSFHSLEDRLVKRFMRAEAAGERLPEKLPVTAAEVACRARPRLRCLGKPVRPSAAECQRNPRARSAVLRVAERLEAQSEEGGSS
jgi:16S rRNA (cytosine1402-N4)-methyltransferase